MYLLANEEIKTEIRKKVLLNLNENENINA